MKTTVKDVMTTHVRDRLEYPPEQRPAVLSGTRF